MTRLAPVALLAGLALGGCNNEPPPSSSQAPPVLLEQTEIKRGQDACKAYVDQVCGCAERQPVLKQPCGLARALPDAIEVSTEVALSPESKPKDARQARDSFRGVVRECIEQLAKIRAAGCN